MWLHRNELSFEEKRTRAVYRALRDELDRYLVDYSLVDSFHNFLKAGRPWPFVEKREMKPRAKVSEVENALMNTFIVIFTEQPVPAELKKYIRYFSDNKVVKENLGELKLAGLNLSDRFQTKMKYFETNRFYDLLRALMPVDYALLIQRDGTARHKNRFMLSHFHVRIDWLIDSAAETLGRELRYISKDLYEKGDDFAQAMTEKLFEYYSFHHTISGRRTAAMLAAQLLRQMEFFSAVYVSSSESRTLTSLSENGVSKYTLLQLDNAAIAQIEAHPHGNPDFANQFLIHREKDYGVALFHVVYSYNEHSKSPADGKLRELKPDVQWLRVRNQLLLPKSDQAGARPIRYQVIYDQQDPLS